MVQLPIKRTIERIPGGMMIVPLFTGAIIRTLFPKTPGFFGSFTGALFTGALTILAVFYVCMGSTIEFKATPFILKKGGALFAADNFGSKITRRFSSSTISLARVRPMWVIFSCEKRSSRSSRNMTSSKVNSGCNF